eukprot:11219298-Alexandrium_andersonii.AAC.1
MEGLQFWRELGALQCSEDGSRFVLELSTPLSVWGPLTPPPDEFSSCKVVLLSLFDGVATVRVALDVAMRHYRCTTPSAQRVLR